MGLDILAKMNSWIHCNSCFLYHDEGETDTFYLANCMHIFCKQCLNKKVIRSGSQCCFCKKTVKYKKIDQMLEPKLAAALDPDPSKDFDNIVRNMEMNIRQTDHLHGGIEKADQQAHVYAKIDKETAEETTKLETQLEKVLIQNSILEQLIVEELAKRQKQQQRPFSRPPLLRSQQPDVISSSQNINHMRMNIRQRQIFHAGSGGGASMGGNRPNVTRLSNISTGRNLY